MRTDEECFVWAVGYYERIMKRRTAERPFELALRGARWFLRGFGGRWDEELQQWVRP